jgi:hypothetical protein
LAFCPININIARECRMYTLFQAFYGFGSLAFLTGLENVMGWGGRGRWLGRFERRWNVHIASLAAAAILFKLSADMHELTFMFGFTAAAWIAYRFGATWKASGSSAALRSKYGVLIGAGMLAFAGILWVNSEFVKEQMIHAVKVNDWQTHNAYNHNFYWDMFMTRYPGLMFLLPFGAFVLWKRHGRAGAFMVLSFVPLFLLNSYVFGRKMDRYIFHLFPFFFALAAAGVVPVARALWNAGRPAWTGLSRAQRVWAFLALLPAAGLVFYPWLLEADDALRRPRFADWKNLPDDVRSDLRSSFVVTTNPREFMYYLGKTPEMYTLTEKKKTLSYPGLIDNAGQLKAGVAGHRPVYFIGDEWRFQNRTFFSDGMRDVIRDEFTPVPHSGDARLLIFRSK